MRSKILNSVKFRDPGSGCPLQICSGLTTLCHHLSFAGNGPYVLNSIGDDLGSWRLRRTSRTGTIIPGISRLVPVLSLALPERLAQKHPGEVWTHPLLSHYRRWVACSFPCWPTNTHPPSEDKNFPLILFDRRRS